MRWLFIALVIVLFPIHPSHARRSTRKVNQAWEKLMVNQLVQAYYCIGILGDLHRAKVYPKGKTKRYLRTLFSLLGRQKLFLVKKTKRGSHTQRKYFRQLLATADMLILSVHSLQKVVKNQAGAHISAFLRYRNAAAKNVNKMLRHPLRKRRRYYRGGWRMSLKNLGHHLGSGLALGFLAVGVLADGYFQRILSKGVVKGYLLPSTGLLRSSIKNLNQIVSMLPSSDRIYVQQIQNGQLSILQAGFALSQFIQTRNRKYLKLYIYKRKSAWLTVRSFAKP